MLPSLNIRSGVVRASGREDQWMSTKYAPGSDENPHTFFNPIFHMAIGNMEANTDSA